jgi:hypothetical protein
MKLKIGMRVLEQHASVVIKGAMQHAAELLLSNGSIHITRQTPKSIQNKNSINHHNAILNVIIRHCITNHLQHSRVIISLLNLRRLVPHISAILIIGTLLFTLLVMK